MAQGQIVKWGNSLAIRLPKPVAEEAGMREGDGIVIEVAEGRVALRKKDSIPSLRELVAQMSAGNPYREISTGTTRGKEAVEW